MHKTNFLIWLFFFIIIFSLVILVHIFKSIPILIAILLYTEMYCMQNYIFLRKRKVLLLLLPIFKSIFFHLRKIKKERVSWILISLIQKCLSFFSIHLILPSYNVLFFCSPVSCKNKPPSVQRCSIFITTLCTSLHLTHIWPGKMPVKFQHTPFLYMDKMEQSLEILPCHQGQCVLPSVENSFQSPTWTTH